MTTKRPSRARITDRDALYLGFLAKFPAADASAMSYLATKQATPFGIEEGGLTEPSGIEKRMAKLVKMGAVTRFRNPISGTSHYGVTPLGIEAATFYNYDTRAAKGIDGLSISRLEHYRCISLVAAQLLSPTNHFSKNLGLPSVRFDQLVSENEMRQSYDQTTRLLKQRADAGQGSSDFGIYRKQLFTKLDGEARAGNMDYSSIVPTYTTLLTIGTVKNDASKMKPIHQPDLAVVLDTDKRSASSPKGKNWIIEVEISHKSQEDYDRILRTFNHEFAEGTAYERAIYFTGSDAIANTIKRVDRESGTNLIGKKRMIVLPIEGRNGRENLTAKRIVVPKGADATVPEDEPLPPIE